MSDLDALLAGIVADPSNALRWLVMADWLEDHGFPERAELVRVHRELLRTCTDPDAFPERPQLHARMMELMRAGVRPCLPQKTLTLPGGVVLTMSFIPPGSFLMGTPDTERDRSNDERLHAVTLTNGFWLGVSPVTQAQWLAVTGENPSSNPGETHPVECVSWDDCQAFCARMWQTFGLPARFPTEAEWEYACRAGTTTPFYWGGELNGTQANCNGDVPYGTSVAGPHVGTTTPVGRYAAVSPHPWGLVDLVGNVIEWCSDWSDEYPSGPVVDPVVDPKGPPTGTRRTLRCGGFSLNGRYSRSGARDYCDPDVRNNNEIGFRLAADLE